MLGRRGFGLGALALAAGGGAMWLGDARAGDVAERAAEIGRRHGLLIAWPDPARFFVPPFGPADARIPDGRAAPANPANLAPALDGIAESIDLYPPGFYRRLCRAIFLCGPLHFGAAAAGGTYGPAWIVLAADPAVGPGGIRETARLGVHHEFSSLVLPHVPWMAARWTALLPAGWRPTARTEDALDRQGEENGRDGFLSAYAATSAENDFNTYAETAFGDPGRLLATAARYPVVARKAKLLTGAYAALDPRMTAAFRALGLGALAAPPGGPLDGVTIAPVAMPQPVVSGG